MQHIVELVFLIHFKIIFNLVAVKTHYINGYESYS